jgi:hypothetical protein
MKWAKRSLTSNGRPSYICRLGWSVLVLPQTIRPPPPRGRFIWRISSGFLVSELHHAMCYRYSGPFGFGVVRRLRLFSESSAVAVGSDAQSVPGGLIRSSTTTIHTRWEGWYSYYAIRIYLGLTIFLLYASIHPWKLKILSHSLGNAGKREQQTCVIPLTGARHHKQYSTAE